MKITINLLYLFFFCSILFLVLFFFGFSDPGVAFLPIIFIGALIILFVLIFFILSLCYI